MTPNIAAVGLTSGAFGSAIGTATALPLRISATTKPLSPQVHDRVLKQVDDDLVKEGILARAGSNEVGAKLAAELSFERTYCLPTQGIVVKGCLDKCSTCEPSREKAIALDLERKALENKLLERQIELLEKSQEYRCCPAGEEEDTSGEDG